jgi:hypothetical protein
MAIFLAFPDFYVFRNGASSSTRKGVLLLVVTSPPLGNDYAVPQSHSLRKSEFTANQFFLATSPLRPTTIFFQLNTGGYSPYVTSSLMRGWVSRLQLLLVLASAVNLRSESRGTHDHLLLSQFRDSHNLVGQVTVFISLRNRVARLYPQALGYIFVASYDSQDYGGGIRPCLHTRSLLVI